MLISEFLDLIGQLPVHEVTFALGNRNFLLVHITQNLSTGWAIRRKQFFERPCSEIHAGFGHYRVDNLGCTVEISTTGGVITQSSTANTVFVLLVPLLSSLFVLLNQLDVPQGHRTQVKRINYIAVS